MGLALSINNGSQLFISVPRDGKVDTISFRVYKVGVNRVSVLLDAPRDMDVYRKALGKPETSDADRNRIVEDFDVVDQHKTK